MFILDNKRDYLVSGVFVVRFLGEPVYVGSSMWIGPLYRDYMGWVKRGKAPKQIQACADKMLESGSNMEDVINSFTYEILHRSSSKHDILERRKYYRDILNCGLLR